MCPMSRLVTVGQGRAGGASYRGCPESTVRPGSISAGAWNSPGLHVPATWAPHVCRGIVPQLVLAFHSELGQFPLDAGVPLSPWNTVIRASGWFSSCNGNQSPIPEPCPGQLGLTFVAFLAPFHDCKVKVHCWGGYGNLPWFPNCLAFWPHKISQNVYLQVWFLDLGEAHQAV